MDLSSSRELSTLVSPFVRLPTEILTPKTFFFFFFFFFQFVAQIYNLTHPSMTLWVVMEGEYVTVLIACCEALQPFRPACWHFFILTESGKRLGGIWPVIGSEISWAFKAEAGHNFQAVSCTPAYLSPQFLSISAYEFSLHMLISIAKFRKSFYAEMGKLGHSNMWVYKTGP